MKAFALSEVVADKNFCKFFPLICHVCHIGYETKSNFIDWIEQLKKRLLLKRANDLASGSLGKQLTSPICKFFSGDGTFPNQSISCTGP